MLYKEIFTMEKGIFSYIPTITNSTINTNPTDDIKKALDFAIYIQIQNRELAPVMDVYSSVSDKEEYLNTVGKYISGLYCEKWTKLLDDLSLKYDVLNPYDYTESTKEKNTSTNTANNKSTDSEKTYGFSNVNAVPANDNSTINENTSNATNENSREITSKGNRTGDSYSVLLKREIELRKQKLYDYIIDDVKNIIVIDVW